MYSNNKQGHCCCNDSSPSNNCCNITPLYYPSSCCCCPAYDQHNTRIKRLSKPNLTVPEMRPSIESFPYKSPAKTKKKTAKMKKVTEGSLQGPGSKGEIYDRRFLGVRSSLSETFLRAGSEKTSNVSLRKLSSLGRQKMSSKLMIPKDQRGQYPNTLDYSQEASDDPTRLGGKSSRTEENFLRTGAEKIDHHIMPTGINLLKSYCYCCGNESPANICPANLSKHSFASSKSSPQLDVICEEGTEVENMRKLGKGRPEEKAASSSTKFKKQKKLEDSCTEFLTIVCDNILESVQKSVDDKLKEFSKEASMKIDVLGERMATNESVIQSLCCDVLKKITDQNQSNFEELCSRVQNLVQNQTPLRAEGHYPRGPMTVGSSHQNDGETAGLPLRVNISRAPLSQDEAKMTTGSSHQSDRETPGLQPKVTKSTIPIGTKVIHQQLTWQHYKRTIKATIPTEAERMQQQQSARDAPKIIVSKHQSDKKSSESRQQAEDSITAAEDRSSKANSLTTLAPAAITSQNSAHEACEFGNAATEDRCRCSHCCKDYCEEAQFNHPCCPNENISATQTHPCENVRESGGYMESEGISSGFNIEEMKLHGLSAKSLSIQEMKLHDAAASPQHSCDVEFSSSSPTTVTTLSLSPAGKTVFNCTCFTRYNDGDRLSMTEASGCKTANNNSLDVKTNCLIRCDSCDTSGYASDPEDKKEDNIESNSDCRKLLRNTSKIPCIYQTSGSNISKLSPAALAANQIKANGANQTVPKSTGSSSINYSSSSRLFRL